jgi:hypothetical protein
MKNGFCQTYPGADSSDRPHGKTPMHKSLQNPNRWFVHQGNDTNQAVGTDLVTFSVKKLIPKTAVTGA